MRDTKTVAPLTMASLPAGRKTLSGDWWRREFELGTTLLARELKREFREQRRLTGQDERLQREARAYARWAFNMKHLDCLPKGGRA